ncbi:acetyl-coenzyme A transporter 1-like [Vespa mandarinia]|uniref:acetyl-coenzyme A transporter 1-like n=3 Tax=Vespa TaxID=7443 RepID=UPI001619F02A|nr:acetyl-coenzyme A transporter 1-like [Vespa mandarinia]XP_035734294.1 acetyl-coenzyme A transporter 1-like [Vespa mandarinia]XP_047371266.1 acetyl-coenzyme A transporter 1 isoform X1 [Vespa velutina]XP_047371275.1 acetyl-coenzyme A transporter 1 isoform X1 [Vespa velutina]
MGTNLRRKIEKNDAMEEGVAEHNHIHDKADIRGDEKNIAILFFLYLLQGIPLGLCGSIPMLLQNRGVSYRQQAEFSFVQWPFSLKLFWAPIVDSVFYQKFGRRKTWLIPTQYLMGMFMLVLSGHVDHWLGKEHEKPNIEMLTALFFALNVLAATQDIVVDGWALTMLKRCNVAYASTCNSVGQTAGYFIGYVLFMALESAEFCNGYLRSVPSNEGILTLPGFLYFWGWIFIITTTFIALLKGENKEKVGKDEELNTNIRHAYKLLWDIVKLPSIKTTILFLLTAKIGFSACDAVTGLKLVEAGIPKEKFALMAVPMTPLQIFLPLAISKYTVGPRPMDIYMKAMPYRLAFGLIAACLVWITPYIINNGQVPMYYFIILIVLYLIHQISASCMFVASMAFFAKVSDPAVGGTYMTLLNTLSNLGANWPATAALWFVDPLTLRQCSTDASNDCSTLAEKQLCTSTNGGTCIMQLDGYYIESLLCLIIGFSWLRWGKRKVNFLQARPISAWKINLTRQNR